MFPLMTVLENLEMDADIERDRARIAGALERVFVLFPIPAERRRQKAGPMSGGEQQMVAIAIAATCWRLSKTAWRVLAGHSW